MKGKCSTVASMLLKRTPAIIIANVRQSAPFIPVRWHTTQIPPILPTEKRDTFSSPPDGHVDKGKEKATGHYTRDGRTALLQKVVLELEKGIEESKEWQDSKARYPGLKTKQISLVTLLTGVIEKMDKARARLSGSEVLLLHTTIVKADRHLRSIMAGERRFQESSVAYTMMLKYASRLSDARSLKEIAREALTWKHNQGPTMSFNRRYPRFIHPRVAAAEQLSSLIRNLFVSLSVKGKTRIRRDQDFLMPGVKLPISIPYMQPGDDAMTISMMLRRRLGGFRMATNEEGQQILEFAKNVQASRYPLTHRSSKIRHINRMAERGKLEKWMNRGKIEETEQGTEEAARVPALKKSGKDPSTSLAVPTAASRVAARSENTEVMELLSTGKENEIQSQQMEALRRSYGRWQRELSRRMDSRRQMIGVLRQFKIRPDTSKPETIEAIKNILPAWLVLTVLRLQIESGDTKKAEKAIEVYLKSISKVYQGKKLNQFIPVNEERVHAVTSPLIPPNGSSLLNGLLRAHLNSGAGDCFENMLKVINKWAFKGNRFNKAILMKKVEGNGQSNPPKYIGCLVPNHDTLLILMEALQRRVYQYTLGKILIQEMWLRWGIVGLRDERINEVLTEPNRHQALKIPQQAFTRLLKWAQKSRIPEMRQKRINEVIELEGRWRGKAFGSRNTFLGASIKHKLGWKKAVDSSSLKIDLREKLDDEEDQSAECTEKEENLDDYRVPLYFTRN